MKYKIIYIIINILMIIITIISIIIMGYYYKTELEPKRRAYEFKRFQEELGKNIILEEK